MGWTHGGSALFFPSGICQLFRKSPPHPAPWCSRGNYLGHIYLFIFAQIISYLSSHFLFLCECGFFFSYLYLFLPIRSRRAQSLFPTSLHSVGARLLYVCVGTETYVQVGNATCSLPLH